VKQRTVNSGMLLYVSGFRRLQLCEKFFSSFFYDGAWQRDWKIFLAIFYKIYISSTKKFHKKSINDEI